MSAHTPGPWSVGMRSGHNANIIYARDGSDQYTDTGIAQIYGVPLNTMISDVPAKFAKGLSDARLIAAAPDLVVALEAVIATDQANRDEGSHGYAMGSPVDRVWRNARAALAKAKGEA